MRTRKLGSLLVANKIGAAHSIWAGSIAFSRGTLSIWSRSKSRGQGVVQLKEEYIPPVSSESARFDVPQRLFCEHDRILCLLTLLTCWRYRRYRRPSLHWPLNFTSPVLLHQSHPLSMHSILLCGIIHKCFLTSGLPIAFRVSTGSVLAILVLLAWLIACTSLPEDFGMLQKQKYLTISGGKSAVATYILSKCGSGAQIRFQFRFKRFAWNNFQYMFGGDRSSVLFRGFPLGLA